MNKVAVNTETAHQDPVDRILAKEIINGQLR